MKTNAGLKTNTFLVALASCLFGFSADLAAQDAGGELHGTGWFPRDSPGSVLDYAEHLRVIDDAKASAYDKVDKSSVDVYQRELLQGEDLGEYFYHEIVCEGPEDFLFGDPCGYHWRVQAYTLVFDWGDVHIGHDGCNDD